MLQVTATFSVPCLLACTFPGAAAGRRNLNVLLAYLVPVSSPLRITVKEPLGASPASNVPEIVWLAPPAATFWLGVEGPSTYSPTVNCIRSVRAETVTEELDTTWPSEGEVICPAEPARQVELAMPGAPARNTD
ncbi:hypothetical protein B0I32_10830 [Nonomuraea fuscirosea]|uniref:Uncharacterized protein n=1 Tax=Nonomuraea fuscirosea TaxID=1291556 RepID=A0A2T0MZ74_9ACTN|nr:hypothetical protein B0I32_10830 [Nonomuraea fuscirosea]